MKLSDFTKDVLKNFSNFNDGILIKKDSVNPSGTVVKTVNLEKSMQSIAVIPEKFDHNIALYDMKPILSILSSLPDNDVEFSDKSMKITSGNISTAFTYAREETIFSYYGDITLEGLSLKFDIPAEDMDKLLKFADVMQLPHIKFEVVDGNVIASADNVDASRSSDKSLKINLGKPKEQSNLDLSITITRNLINFIKGDYAVDIYEKGRIRFKNVSDKAIEYILLKYNKGVK